LKILHFFLIDDTINLLNNSFVPFKFLNHKMKKYSSLLASASILSLVIGFGLNSVSALDETELSITVDPGILTVSIVDDVGDLVPAPEVPFVPVTTQFVDQATDGTLGIMAGDTDPPFSVGTPSTTQQILLSNPTDTEAWTVTLAATDGPTAEWSDGTNSMDFNGLAANSEGRLSLSPQDAGVVIAKVNYDASNGQIDSVDSSAGAITGVTAGSDATFLEGTVNSITVFTADNSADDYASYVLREVPMSQNIPMQQEAGDYVLNMVLTAS